MSLVKCKKKEFKVEYTFVKPVDTKLGLVYDWCLKVSDIATLLDYEEKIMGSNIRKAFREEIKFLEGKIHQPYECFAATISQKEGKSFVESLARFFDKAAQGRFTLMKKYGTLYIQKTCGYFFHDDYIKITAEKKVNDIVWPEGGEVRYMKWPNGKHWYAKIGDLDVKVDGQMKWDTKQEAEEAVKKFVRSL